MTSTTHVFTTTGEASGDGTLIVGLVGDYNSTNEYVNMYIDGNLFESNIWPNLDCEPDFSYFSFDIGADVINQWLSDDQIEIELQMSNDVNPVLCSDDYYAYNLDAHSVQVMFPMEDGVDWLSISDQSGSIAPGSSQVIDLTIDGVELELADYLSNIIITSNDPDESQITVPVNLSVVACEDVDVDAICDDVDDCIGDYDCAGVCNGNAVVDQCGVCNGNDEDLDNCGICFGDNSTCIYYSDIPEDTGMFDMIIIESTTGFEEGDEIGLFDDSGIVDTQCFGDNGQLLVGSNQWSDGQINIQAVIGIDLCEYGGERLIGATTGNDIKVRVYKPSLGIEFDAIVEFESGNRWGDYVTVINLLSANPGCTDSDADNYDPLAAYDDGSCEYTQIVEIRNNIVNMISFNINPDSTLVQDLFTDEQDILFVSNDVGEFYIPEYNFNTINYLDIKGYYSALNVNADSSQFVEISGKRVDLSTEINLVHHKSNLLPYLPSEEYHIEDVFGYLYDEILFVANDQGQYWIPSLGVSSLESMNAGSGYLLFLKSDIFEDITFSYDYIGSFLSRVNNIKYFDSISMKPDYYNVSETGISHPLVIENITGDINTNDELAVYANDKLIGSTKLLKDETQYIIPLWKEVDQHGLYLDGFTYGDNIELRYWKKETNQEFLVNYNFNETRLLDQHITHGDIIVTDIASSIDEFALSKAYPNPFNPKTSLELTVPEDGYVSVKVYNLMGQEMDILLEGFVSAGSYNLLWLAADAPSGVYMVRAENGVNHSTQKIMLLK